MNPFDLLGVTIGSTEAEARAAFRELALLAHPDKGGRAEEMRVLMHAYRYVVEQLAAVNHTRTVEDLERGFAAFCLEQHKDEDLRPSWLSELLNLSPGVEFDDLFGRRWREAHGAHGAHEAMEEGPTSSGPLPEITGYGSSMAPSEYAAPSGGRVEPVAYRATWEKGGVGTVAPATYAEFRRAVVVHAAPRGADSLKPDCSLASSDYALAFNVTPEELPSPYGSEAPIEALLQTRLAERQALLNEQSLYVRASK